MFETVVSKVTDTALSKLRHNIRIPENQTYPIDIMRDVPKYEKLNNFHIVIYKEENGKASQFYNNKITDGVEKKEILLLLFSNETDEHLIWIKNQSAFFKNSAGNFKKLKKIPCLNCQNFSGNSQERLDEHRIACLKNELSQVHLLKENSYLQFNNEGNSFMHPFTCFADFESTLLKCNESQGKRCYWILSLLFTPII
jgi:hypothetical protein